MKDGAARRLSEHGSDVHFPYRYGFLTWLLSLGTVPTPASDPSCHSPPLEHDINGHAWYKQAHESRYADIHASSQSH